MVKFTGFFKKTLLLYFRLINLQFLLFLLTKKPPQRDDALVTA